MEELEKNILNKKIDSYYTKINDFAVAKELTVEITLNEYRDLITQVATKEHDIDKANSDKYIRDNENKQLKDKLKDLEILLLKYKNKYGELEENIEEHK